MGVENKSMAELGADYQWGLTIVRWLKYGLTLNGVNYRLRIFRKSIVSLPKVI